MTSEELRDVLARHELFCRNKEGGQRADLRGADLRDADLRGVNLREACLRNANLRGANLRGADLTHADCGGADLRDVNGQGALMEKTGLERANLGDADLRGADLRGARLWAADLHRTRLRGADVRNVDFSYAILEFTLFDPTVRVWQFQSSGRAGVPFTVTVWENGRSEVRTATYHGSIGDLREFAGRRSESWRRDYRPALERVRWVADQAWPGWTRRSRQHRWRTYWSTC